MNQPKYIEEGNIYIYIIQHSAVVEGVASTGETQLCSRCKAPYNQAIWRPADRVAVVVVVVVVEVGGTPPLTQWCFTPLVRETLAVFTNITLTVSLQISYIFFV